MRPNLYVLLREGNPDCACGEEFVGLTDSIEIAEAWLKAEPEAMYDKVEINSFSVDGRSRFAKVVQTVLLKRNP